MAALDDFLASRRASARLDPHRDPETVAADLVEAVGPSAARRIAYAIHAATGRGGR